MVKNGCVTIHTYTWSVPECGMEGEDSKSSHTHAHPMGQLIFIFSLTILLYMVVWSRFFCCFFFTGKPKISRSRVIRAVQVNVKEKREEKCWSDLPLNLAVRDCLEQFSSGLGRAAEPVKFSRILRKAIRIGGEGYPVKTIGKKGKANAEAKNYNFYLWIFPLHVLHFCNNPLCSYF